MTLGPLLLIRSILTVMLAVTGPIAPLDADLEEVILARRGPPAGTAPRCTPRRRLRVQPTPGRARPAPRPLWIRRAARRPWWAAAAPDPPTSNEDH